MTFAVIGSGPCGTLAALQFLKAGHAVVIFDVNSTEAINFKGLSNTLKVVDGSSAAYDIHQMLRMTHQNEELGFYRSKISGGFSNVWGATWGSQESLKSDDWDRHHGIVTDLLVKDGYLGDNLNEVCNCFNFIQDRTSRIPLEITFQKTLLALNPNICDCIPDGYSSCSHGSVWNSKSFLSQCFLYKNFEFRTGKDVTLIEDIRGKLIIKGAGFSEEFRNVIIAAGTVGTVEILLNSDLGIKEIILQDTLMCYLPLLRFGVRKKHRGGFAFSQYSFDFKFGRKKLSAHAQLYADSEIYRERIIGKLPDFLKPILKQLVQFILPHMAIAIIYRDAASSPRLSFNKLAKAREINVDFLSPTNSALGLKRRVWRIFRSLGFLPLLPLLAWSKPGESYHLGAMENKILDEFGTMKSIPGLHIAGAISLPSVQPGPITHSAMAQTSRLVERILYQNFERT
jgi:hypothetical protein